MFVIVVEENKKQLMVLFGNIKINYYIYSNIYDQNIMSKSKKEGKPKRNSVKSC